MADYSEALSEISGYPKALSHAGSGGGGDLSTAKVKINGDGRIFLAHISENISASFGAVTGNGNTYDVILANGKAAGTGDIETQVTVISGAAELAGGRNIMITGDCEIDVSTDAG